MSEKIPVVIKRHPVSHLSEIVYGTIAMTKEMAEAIRTLRRDHGVDYSSLGYYLCESDPDAGGSFGLGKALTEVAASQLQDHDPSWT